MPVITGREDKSSYAKTAAHSATGTEPLTPLAEIKLQAAISAPPGYRLVSVREEETSSGTAYVAAYEPIPEPKGLAEQMMDIKMVPLAQQAGFPQPIKPGVIYGAKPTPKPVLAPLAGATATIESFVYSVPKLVGVKGLPRSPPTLSGGAVGKAVEGAGRLVGIDAPSRELEETMGYGPEYAAGTVVGDILLSYGISKGSSAIYHRIRGVKVGKIAGATELEKATGTGKALETTRVTRPIMETERVSPKIAEQLREFQRYVQPEDILLGGSQIRAEQYVDDTLRVVSGSAEAAREATPYVQTMQRAVTTQPSLARKMLEKLHLASIEPEVASVSAKKLETATTSFASKTIGLTQKGKAVLLSTERIIAPEAVFPSGSAIARKTFTGALIEGTIDTQTYLGLVKAVGPAVAQKWYPQMGGVTASQLFQKTAPTTIKVVTKIIEIAPKMGIAKALATTAIGISATKLVKPTRKPSITIPFTEPESTVLTSSRTLPTVAPKPKPISYPISYPITEPTTRTHPSEIVTPKVYTSPITEPVTLPRLITPTPTKSEPFTHLPPPRLVTPSPKRPFAWPRTLFAGGGRKRRGGVRYGKWYFKRHPIPSATQQLANLGFIQTKKKKRRSKRKR